MQRNPTGGSRVSRYSRRALGRLQSTLSLRSSAAGSEDSFFGLAITDQSMGPVASARQAIRVKLESTPWYESPAASLLRKVFYSTPCHVTMAVALGLALLLPDLWVLWGIDSNVGIDVVLSVLMVLFLVEFLCLIALDSTYLLGWFAVMDAVGFLSMVFDISFLLGSGHTEARTVGGGSQSLAILRTTRSARIGAKVARLARTVKFLRFLPLFSPAGPVARGGDAAATAAAAGRDFGQATVLVSRITYVLATRTSLVTVLLVVLVYLLDIMTFPQHDHSMEVWAQRLSRTLAENSTLFAAEFVELTDFYADQGYGPYEACRGVAAGSSFTCHASFPAFAPTYGRPPRGASSLQVHEGSLMVAYNLHQAVLLEAGVSLLSICSIICIMLYSGLALTSVVTNIAVLPLEHMLASVGSVFKLGRGGAGQRFRGHGVDVDATTETEVLERVVRKLMTISSFHRSTLPQMGAMGSEDIGVATMMLGGGFCCTSGEGAGAKGAEAPSGVAKQSFKAPTVVLVADDFGVRQRDYDSWAYNAAAQSEVHRTGLMIVTISANRGASAFLRSTEETAALAHFVKACEQDYQRNPFHNFSHAADVLYAVTQMLRLVCAEAFLGSLEQFSLLVAAVGHDLGHPGVSNGFLSEVGHELALCYNDRSPLENMHCSRLYKILALPEANICAKLSREQFSEMRQLCIEAILHTDMASHFTMVKELQMLYQMHCEVFSEEATSSIRCNPVEELEIFRQPDKKLLITNTFLHAGDISNPCRAWEVTQAWAMCVLEEFFAQGDQEKQLGIPVQFLNDRDQLNKAFSQIGFLEFIIAPFFAAKLHLWPQLRELGDNLMDNTDRWAKRWAAETDPKPDEEARSKVRDRVAKLRTCLQGAQARTGLAAA